MELNRSTKWLYFLLGLWMLFILSLGAWWTHLYLKFSDLNTLRVEADEFYRVVRMLKYEGITVFIGLLALSVLIIVLFSRDQQKTRSVRSFFASLTHEMKTPLASIKLQTQVLVDLLSDLAPEQFKKIEPFANRLLDDGRKLETEMDEILQLARLESGGTLELEPTDVREVFQDVCLSYPNIKTTAIAGKDQDLVVKANKYALSLIFRNLIENTRKHQSMDHPINVRQWTQGSQVFFEYNDKGKPFDGDISQLGNLFYRHRSEKGTGLGLYLINKLMSHMNGKMTIKQDPNLIFSLAFERVSDVS